MDILAIAFQVSCLASCVEADIQAAGNK